MSERCFAAEEIGTILALPPGDPRRRHLGQCPRCRALARGYRSFMEPAPLPAAADAAGARSELSRRLADALATTGPAAVRHAGPPPAGRGRRPGPQQTLLAMAAVLAVCAGIFLVQDLNLQQGPRVVPGAARLRGAPAGATGLTVAAVADGWRIAWRRPDAAEAARVVLYDGELQELATLDAGPADALRLDATAGRAVTDRGDTLRIPPAAIARIAIVRVEFLAGGDVLGRSGARTLPRS